MNDTSALTVKLPKGRVDINLNVDYQSLCVNYTLIVLYQVEYKYSTHTSSLYSKENNRSE